MRGPLVFSFGLFHGKDPDQFAYYRNRAIVFIRTMIKQFPGCSFVAHVLDTVKEIECRAIVAAAGGRCTVKRYAFSKKRGSYWLVGAMRLRTLWEHPGIETVVVCDIHDEPKLQSAEVGGNRTDWSIFEC